MDGYYRPKFKREEKELHTLELADCDFISDGDIVKSGVSTHLLQAAT